MATKTVILRPTGNSSLWPDSSIIVYPSDTTSEQAYLLVNESVADDNATYVAVSNSLVGFEISFELPENRSIIGSRLHVRVNCTSFKYNMSFKPSENNDFSNKCQCDINSDGWEDYAIDLINDDYFMTNFSLNQFTTFLVGFYAGSISSSKGGNNDTPVVITQVYLELTYEEPEITAIPLYLRENGTWNAVSGTIYRKENGAWVESDDSVFTNGDQFALNVIN